MYKAKKFSKLVKEQSEVTSGEASIANLHMKMIVELFLNCESLYEERDDCTTISGRLKALHRFFLYVQKNIYCGATCEGILCLIVCLPLAKREP